LEAWDLLLAFFEQRKCIGFEIPDALDFGPVLIADQLGQVTDFELGHLASVQQALLRVE